jgi:hypothetical protein
MMHEHVDHRVLAALRFVDATIGSQVAASLDVVGAGVRVIRNRTGLHVVVEAPGFDAYTAAFRDPPAVPAGSVTLTVHDRGRRYLSRQVAVALPRDPEPTHAGFDDSLFRPVDVALYPAPAGALGVGWAVLRLSVKRGATDQGLPYAYVRVVRDSDDELLAVGMADHRGEALVTVAGIPVTSWNTTSISTSPVVSSVAAHVTAYFDPTAYDERTGRWPDPDVLEQTFSTLAHSAEESFDLASGHAEARRIGVLLPP